MLGRVGRTRLRTQDRQAVRLDATASGGRVDKWHAPMAAQFSLQVTDLARVGGPCSNRPDLATADSDTSPRSAVRAKTHHRSCFLFPFPSCRDPINGNPRYYPVCSRRGARASEGRLSCVVAEGSWCRFRKSSHAAFCAPRRPG